jgi:hypothetical protein
MKYSWIWITLITIIIVLLWYVSWTYVDNKLFPICEEINTAEEINQAMANRGAFGDKFGFINSLFSGLALAGIIFSIYLQRQELRETRQEFKDQNFQTTFFNLLKTQQAITQEIDCEIVCMIDSVDYNSTPFKGRQFFEQSKFELRYLTDAIKHPKYSSFDEDFQGVNKIEDELPKLKERRKQLALKVYGIKSIKTWEEVNKLHDDKISMKAYDYFFEKHQYIIGHYFRHLYHILSFLSNEKKSRLKECNKSEISEVTKEMNKFSDFIQAQLSTYELFLLFYNSQNYHKMQKYMIEFNFYKPIPYDALLNDEDKKLLVKLRLMSKDK